ncbi:Protein archease-like [Entamoeba marina]
MPYQYLDHPADVILHSWGNDITEAFTEAATGMMGFMTDLKCIDNKEQRKISLTASNFEEALVKFLEEWLCVYSSDLFIGKTFKCTVFDDEDEDNIHIECIADGEIFDLKRHQQGTEIKAITWHNLEIYDDEEDQTHIEILLDI